MKKFVLVLFAMALSVVAVWAEGETPSDTTVVRRAVIGKVSVDSKASVTPADQTPPSGVSVVTRQEIGEVTLTPGALGQLRGLVRGNGGTAHRNGTVRRSGGSSVAWSKLTGRVKTLEDGHKELEKTINGVKGDNENPGLVSTVIAHGARIDALGRGFNTIDETINGKEPSKSSKGTLGLVQRVSALERGRKAVAGVVKNADQTLTDNGVPGGLWGLLGLFGVPFGLSAVRASRQANRSVTGLTGAFNAELEATNGRINGLRQELIDAGVAVAPPPPSLEEEHEEAGSGAATAAATT